MTRILILGAGCAGLLGLLAAHKLRDVEFLTEKDLVRKEQRQVRVADRDSVAEYLAVGGRYEIDDCWPMARIEREVDFFGPPASDPPRTLRQWFAYRAQRSQSRRLNGRWAKRTVKDSVCLVHPPRANNG